MGKIALSFAFVFFASISSEISYAVTVTVNSWYAKLETESGRKGDSVILDPCTVIDSDKGGGGYLHVNYFGRDGWLRREYVAIYENIFSDLKSKPSLSAKIVRENDRDFLFYHIDGKLVKYNITDRLIETEQKVPDFQEIYPSPRDGLFVIKGVITNVGTVDNLEFCDLTSGKFAFIGSFKEGLADICSLKFSDDASYLAIMFLVTGKRLICVYKTDRGALVANTTEASDFNWRHNILILNDSKNFWTNDFSGPVGERLDFKKENLLFRVRPEWLSRGFLKSSVINGILYLDTGRGVIKYDFMDGTIAKTQLKSLNFSRDLNLNYYLHNNRVFLYNFRLGHDLEEFRGNQPEVSFEGFAESNIIGRSKYEKIDTIFLYSGDGGIVYRYKAIDNPMAISESGILAEVSMDRDLTILTIEDPEKQEFFYIFDRGNR